MISDSELKQKIEKWLEGAKREYVGDVIGAVSIPSVSVFTEGRYPFGVHCAEMLDYMGKCAKRYGFEYTNHDYYCGTSLIPGSEGKAEIGMFGHTDVVEAGDGWTVEPFRGQERDGYIIGRGSNDNKGSTFACLYAMRFFRENGIRLKNNVRLLYGCNEESGMEDVKYYGKKCGFPDLTIVPDSWFPVSRCEKGILKVIAEAEVKSGNLISFQAGVNEITIPNKATCVITGHTEEEVRLAASGYSRIHYEAQPHGIMITADGVAKHAAFPEGSVNAIMVLASFLVTEGLVSGDAKRAMQFLKESLADYEGRALGIDFRDEVAGNTNHTIAMAELVGEKLVMHINIRYPAAPSVSGDVICQRIAKYFDRPFLRIVSTKQCLPHAIDPDHFVAKTLCSVSEEVLGQPMKPFVQAGGTYTSVTPNSFAAGPAVHGREQRLFSEKGHGGAHQPDECMEIEVLLNGIRIYIMSLLRIDEWLSGQLGK